MRYISPGFFQTSGTALIAGRDFAWVDLYEKRNVAVISENMAREMWGSAQSAVGKRIRESMNDPGREVIGVVADVYDEGVHEKAPAIVYWPAMMKSVFDEDVYVRRTITFLIRTPRAGTSAFLNEAKQAVWGVNASQPIFLVRTLKQVYDGSMARTSFTLVMLAVAATMALMLSIVGIYGVISSTVNQRRPEIGVRMALGAQAVQVGRMVVAQSLRVAGVGIAIGLVGAFATTRVLRSLLFGVNPTDPATLAGVTLVLIALGAGAAYAPARRATRVDPVEVLRRE